MERQEHLAWCKNRALQYVDAGDINQAWASMVSDMCKHDETKEHSAIMLGSQLMLSGQLNSPDAMRKFIKGFN